MTRAIAVVFAACLVACDSAERRDAQVVVSAIRRFRTADNPSTPAAVEALRSTPCSTSEVCEAKAACLTAGDATATSLLLNAEVERGLAALEKGSLNRESPEAQALPMKLDESKTLLRKGMEGLPGCDERVQALKRKHGI